MLNQGNLISSFDLSRLFINDFRLTLTSGMPIPISDVTGATAVYATPYSGRNITLYNGSMWLLFSSTEFSVSLGTVINGRPYDVFCYANNESPTLELLAWTDNTTRAVALSYLNGIPIKSTDNTRRYLGTIYTTSTTTTEDSLAKRYLWNYNNRVGRIMYVTEATSSWSYTTATFRQANANTANQLNFVIGVQGDPVPVEVKARTINSANGIARIAGIGLDDTTATINQAGARGRAGNAANYETLHIASYIEAVGIGYHYYAWLEWSTASGTTTWYGASGEIKGIINA